MSVDSGLAARLNEAIAESVAEIHEWRAEHVTLDHEQMMRPNRTYFWAVSYLVDGEPVAYGFDESLEEADRLATRAGRQWVMREIFPETKVALLDAGSRWVAKEMGEDR